MHRPIRLVVTKNRRQFNEYVREKNYKSVKCVFVNSMEDLRGHCNCVMDFYGEWWKGGIGWDHLIEVGEYCRQHSIRTPARVFGGTV